MKRHTVDLVTHLVAREFKIRYARSTLGWLWSVIQPLARLLVLSFLFTRLLPLKVPHYALYLFVGLLGWNWFSAATASATRSALDRRELILRPGVPRAVVPVISVLTDGLDYLASIPVLAVFLVVAGELHATALLLPLVLLPMVLLAMGLGFALCAANVYARDVYLVVDLALLVGFYLTPVFYSVGTLPSDAASAIRMNPLTWALDSQRRVLLAGQLPDAATFGGLCLLSAVTLVLGYLVYARAARSFVDEL